jgi:3-dehydroquinate dehydratase type I
MSRSAAVKIPATVGVIASERELRAAMRMRKPPDFFELRLDYLPDLDPKKITKLRRPLIITARHPAEGGKKSSRVRSGTSPTQSRRELLLKFLPFARFVDIELRSLHELAHVWEEAERFRIKRICSVHDFARTPPHAVLQKQFQRAKRAGADIFKLVTRAETVDDLINLLQFLRRARGQCCVMAMGKFGPMSRLLFPECGSVFVYAPLRRALYPGQLTLQQLRSRHRQAGCSH